MFADRADGIGFARLEEFGWFELLDDDPVVAARAMFDAQGARLATAGTLDAYVLHSLQGLGVTVEAPSSTGVLTGSPQRPGCLLAMVPDGFDARWYVFQSLSAPDEIRAVPVGSVDVRTVDTVDRTIRLVEVDDAVDDEAETVVRDARGLIEAHALIAFSLQLTGLCDRLLEIGRDHALIRHQFGRPIASFQAVQHLLADAAVSVAASQGTAITALGAVRDDDLVELSCLVAAGAAVRAFTTTTASVQQVLGAVGYTREHEFHRFLHRGLVLSFLAGGPTIDQRIGQLARRLGAPPIASPASFMTGPGEEVR
jgi:hypothetical protein